MNHDWTQWFLDRPPNLNSSMNLEVAASEFKCQGLELDRTCVCWSWDFVFGKDHWITRKINKGKGTWGKNDARREYSLLAPGPEWSFGFLGAVTKIHLVMSRKWISYMTCSFKLAAHLYSPQ
jgi:hypothetical protein